MESLPSLSLRFWDKLETMQCAEAIRLERRLKQCQSDFEGMRRQLERGVAILPRREYTALSSRVDEEWTELQQARTALDRHFREHSCLAKRV